jgi:hypothetical protein
MIYPYLLIYQIRKKNTTLPNLAAAGGAQLLSRRWRPRKPSSLAAQGPRSLAFSRWRREDRRRRWMRSLSSPQPNAPPQHPHSAVTNLATGRCITAKDLIRLFSSLRCVHSHLLQREKAKTSALPAAAQLAASSLPQHHNRIKPSPHLTATQPAAAMSPLHRSTARRPAFSRWRREDRRRRWMRSLSSPQPNAPPQHPHFTAAPLVAQPSPVGEGEPSQTVDKVLVFTAIQRATRDLIRLFSPLRCVHSHLLQREKAKTNALLAAAQLAASELIAQASFPAAFFRAKYSRSKIAIMTRFS